MKKTKAKNFSWIIFDKFARYGLTALLGIVLVGESVSAVGKNIGVEIAQQQANSNDAIIAEAQRLTIEGIKLFQQGTAESLKQALGKFESALELWRKVGKKEWQATIMLSIGGVNNSLGYKQKALSSYNQALSVFRQIRYKSGEATTLNNIGLVYSDLGDKQQALKFYNHALTLIREVKGKSRDIREVKTLNNIGLVYSDLGDKQQALKFYNQALILSRQAGDKSGEATTLNNIGFVYSNLGDKQQALKLYNQALPLLREVGNKSQEAITLKNIGGVYSNLGDKQQALKLYNQALALSRQVGDKNEEARILTSIGVVYLNLGDKQQTLKFYNQALALSREVGDKSGEAGIINNIGLFYSDSGDKQQALKFYNQALALSRQVGDKNQEATTLNNIGSVYSDLGDKQQALKFYNQALLLLREIQYKSGEAKTLNNIGLVYDDLGDKQQALKFYNLALPLRREVGDKSGEARTLNNIGLVYNSLGDKQQALKFYNLALPLSREVEYKSGEAKTLHNIGVVYDSLGDKQQALKFYNLALSLNREVGDKSTEAVILNSISLAYNSLGDKEEALKNLNQALPLSRQVGDKSTEAITLNNIGGIYNDLQDKQKALKFYNQALPLRREVEDKGGEAITLNNIAGIYNDLGDKQQALKLSKKALPLMREVGDKSGEATVLSNIAWVYRDNGNLQAALANSKAAIDIIEDLRTKVDSNDLRTSYFATQQDTYKVHIDILMQLHRQNPSKGYDIQALNTSEKARARGLLELLTEANADIRKGANPQLIAQEKQLQQKIEAKEKLRFEIVNDKNKKNDPASQAAAQRLEKEIQNHIFEYKQLTAKIKQSNPEYAALKYPEPLNLQQIQQQLDKDTVLLQYSLGEKRSYLWTVTPDSLDSYELPKREKIETAANKFKELLKKCAKLQNEMGINCHKDLKAEQKAKDFQEITQAATELSKLVFAPVSGKLAKKRLVIVADGALLEIPFAALSEPNQTNYQPLLVNRDIVNLPSVSAIAIHRSELKQRQTAPKTLAVLADAVFSNNDERVTGKPPALAPELDLTRSLLQQAAKSLNRAGWGRLKGTRTEAKEILESVLKFVPASETLQAFDFDANYNWVTDKRLKQYRFIHLATHGFAHPDNPELSRILLSAVDKQNKPLDRVNLLLGDIFNLDWGADLVVLSACETGLGKGVPGEGLIGLTRGLMYAGAEHAVISLWQVDDTATSKLIPQMYKAILEKNLSPAKALRQAQLQMWQKKEWRNPYYWAAFTSQGEWK
jgi:tetratricopeptide (TPR) repeat protein/CHAT domain-containing protein